MSWDTVGGTNLCFPAALWAKLTHFGKVNREDVMDALRETQRIHSEAVALNNRVIELEAKVLRLTHENEFMLRLLNERDL